MQLLPLSEASTSPTAPLSSRHPSKYAIVSHHITPCPISVVFFLTFYSKIYILLYMTSSLYSQLVLYCCEQAACKQVKHPHPVSVASGTGSPSPAKTPKGKIVPPLAKYFPHCTSSGPLNLPSANDCSTVTQRASSDSASGSCFSGC